MCTVAASPQCVFRRKAIHSVPLSFSEDPDILRDLVHLEENFGEGGLEVEPLASVRRSVCGMLYADDVGIVSKSTEDFTKTTVIVTVFESAGFTVPGTKTETTLLRTLNKVLPAPLLVVEGAGKRCIYGEMHFLYLGAVLSTQAPTLCHKINDGSDSGGHVLIDL